MELINGRVRGDTLLYGLLGNPVHHTISPQIHNTLADERGINLIYIPMEVPLEDIEKAFIGLKSLGFSGFNVTIPFKENIANLVDYVDESAKIYGAVNTVKIIDGKTYGYNTDADGFYKDYLNEFEEPLRDKKVLILGAGGAARSIAMKCAKESAKCIVIANRTVERAEELCKEIGKYYKDDISACDIANISYLSERNFDVIINTTSIGMYPDINNSPLDGFDYKGISFLYDIIYNPQKTKLIREAEESGVKTANGFGMLFYQAQIAFELWTEIKIPDLAAVKIFERFKNNLDNII